MFFCGNCKAELEQDSLFCTQCGTPVEKGSEEVNIPVWDDGSINNDTGEELKTICEQRSSTLTEDKPHSDKPRRKRRWIWVIIIVAAVLAILYIIGAIATIREAKQTGGASVTQTNIAGGNETGAGIIATVEAAHKLGGKLTAALLPQWRNDTAFTPGAAEDLNLQSGVFFGNTNIFDAASGFTVANTLLPQGWLTQLTGSWQMPSMYYPGLFSLFAVSPHNDAAMIFVSPQQFRQAVTPQMTPPDGLVDSTQFVQYLAYRDAAALTDLLFAQYFPTAYNRALLNAIPGDNATLAKMREAANHMVAATQQGWNAGGVPQGLAVNVGSPEASLVAQDFRFKSRDGGDLTYYARIITATMGYHEDIGGLHTENRLDWFCPYAFILVAEGEDAFKRYLDVFDIFVGNLRLSQDFIVRSSNLGAQIATAINQPLRFNVSAEITYNVTGGFMPDGPYNNVMTFFWSDAFSKVKKYGLNDGKIVRIPKSYDNIYVDGDGNLFVSGQKANPGDGWAKLK